MANSTISGLTAASAIDGTEAFPVVQSGANHKATAAQIKTYVNTYRGALVKKSTDQTSADYTVATDITWDAESYDTSSFHDIASNTARLTVPSGVSKVRVCGHVRIANIGASNFISLAILKAGSVSYDGSTQLIVSNNTTTGNLIVTSPVLSVSQGDYFTLQLSVGTDTAIDIVAARSWFSIEVVE